MCLCSFAGYFCPAGSSSSYVFLFIMYRKCIDSIIISANCLKVFSFIIRTDTICPIGYDVFWKVLYIFVSYLVCYCVCELWYVISSYCPGGVGASIPCVAGSYGSTVALSTIACSGQCTAGITWYCEWITFDIGVHGPVFTQFFAGYSCASGSTSSYAWIVIFY